MSSQSSKAKRKRTHFTSDAQLLAELGERLVASSDVALAELVKNAYDADATSCHVWLSGEGAKRQLNILDDGHGMTEEEFLRFWMRIAATDKLQRKDSRELHRSLAGSKGVGRFAVRMLGRRLRLTSITGRKPRAGTRLIAEFDWNRFKPGDRMVTVEVPYEIGARQSSEKRGTLLEILELTTEWDGHAFQEITQQLFDILELPGFDWLKTRAKGENDPGFHVYFARPDEDAPPRKSAGTEILDRAVGRARVRVRGKKVEYSLEYSGLKQQRHTVRLEQNLVGAVEGEILYFPKRAGVFRGLETIDGRNARGWLTEKGGVKVFDRGFRIPPYGEEGDDWLGLATSKAERERKFRSPLTEEIFSRRAFETEGSYAPVLKVPHNRQLYGAIAVQSHRPSKGEEDKLQPSMDRQGFLENDGFEQLQHVVRAAVEAFAVLDVQEAEQAAKRSARRRAAQARREIQSAIESVRADESIPSAAKQSIIKDYTAVVDQVDRLKEAQEEANRAIETMGLLGVLSGFMTHETSVMLRAAEAMLASLQAIPQSQRTPKLERGLRDTKEAVDQLRRHIDYAEIFLIGARRAEVRSFKVRPQVDLVLRQLERFTSERGIVASNVVSDTLQTPRLPVSVFSGVLLNLYTNAIKAVLTKGTKPDDVAIQFDAERVDHELCVWISDRGVGIPIELHERVFQPLFSTTGETPLGIGLGLGLSIVRRLVRELGGAVEIVEAPTGFRTCFEVRLPYE